MSTRMMMASMVLWIGGMIGVTMAASEYLSPQEVVASADGKMLYISLATADAVGVFDIASGKLAKQITVPGTPAGLALDAKAGRLYVAIAAVKGAVIAELYGMSHDSMRTLLDADSKDVEAFVSTIRTYFDVETLLKRVKLDFVKNGVVTNRYGRRIVVPDPRDSMLVNSYVQSTGVDVTLLGFSKLVKRLELVAPRSKPIFLLHDALLIDAHRDELAAIKRENTVKVVGYVQKFHLVDTVI